MRTRNDTALAVVALAGAGMLAWRMLAPRSFSYRDKVVIITGGARGLGLVIARRLAREGARLVICSRTTEQLHRAEAELRSGGTAALALHCDMTDPADVQRMVDRTLQQWGHVDVLMNVAGVIQAGPMETMTLDDYRTAIDTHFWGPLYAVHAVLPEMRRRRAGRIVNVSSIGGRVAIPHLLPYSASKFALTGFSEGLRAELKKDGIVVTTVVPGLMRTGSPRNALFKGKHRAEHAWFALGDSSPGMSMSAESAAAQIIEACRRGDSAITLSLPAKLAELFHGVFPGITADLLAVVNRLLPAPGGIGQASLPGSQSQSWLAPSALTTLSDRAAERNNEH
jgi:NAD(P)-dependent dehydrogenase (short-subunit alcohol dehydrogenase family)